MDYIVKLTIKDLPPSLNKLYNMHYHQRAKYKKEWEQRVLNEISTDMLPFQPYNKAVVNFRICFGDNRRHDPDNINAGVSKPALDALVKAGVLEDDSIDNVTLVYSYDRSTPRRFEITIEEEK